MNLALLIIAFPASENERRGRKGGRDDAGMTGASVRRRERGDRNLQSDDHQRLSLADSVSVFLAHAAGGQRGRRTEGKGGGYLRRDGYVNAFNATLRVWRSESRILIGDIFDTLHRISRVHR